MSNKTHSIPQDLTNEESCPVSDAVFGRIYKSRGQELNVLLQELSPAARARLAVFCNARGHLRTVGRLIAAKCDVRSLIEASSGAAGEVLFFQARILEERDALDRHAAGARITPARSAA